MKSLSRRIGDFLRWVWRRLMTFFHQHTLLTFILIFLGSAIVSAVLLELVDHDDEGANPVWRAMVYMLSGLDVGEPKTELGQAVSTITLVAGVVLVSLLTGYIASEFSRLLISSQVIPRKPLRRVFEEHVIIFGWNAKTKAILRELDAVHSYGSFRGNDFVIISNKPELEKGDLAIYEHVWHVPSYGAANDIQVLRNADLMPHRGQGAWIAAILSETQLPPKEADDRSLLNLLAVENLYPEVISIAEVMQDEQSEHFENAYADEIVLPNRYCSLILARTCEYPGVSSFVDELLALAPVESGFGRLYNHPPISFYVVSAEEMGVAGKTLQDAILEAYDWGRGLIAGILDNKDVMLAPDLVARDTLLKNSDWLLVIATPEQVSA